jgi:ubiquinone/menaquinone biosynthesis C-methylase UbiE
MQQRPDYGIDGPLAVMAMIIVSGILFGIVAAIASLGGPHPFKIPACAAISLVGADLLGVAGSMLWYSRFEKLRLRERLRDLIPWRGDEMVLDVGCGRGLWLIGAARLLTSGKATGVDVWRRDLSDNRPEVATQNARLEGVADRVVVEDGDARRLPFADASFDVVVSALVLHNIRDRAGRRQAVLEIARVLKPGGRVVLLDLRFTSDYLDILRQCGLSDTRRRAVWPVFTSVFRLLTWGAVRFYWVTGEKVPAIDAGAP